MRNNKNGFTLIELLTVIAIIGLLSVFAVVALNGARGKAKEAVAKDDLAKLRSAMLMMENELERWPNGCPPWSVRNPEIELAAQQAGLLTQPAVGDQGDGCQWTQQAVDRWNGPYAREVQLDPWNNSYYFDPDYTPYQNCGSEPTQPEAAVLVSFGPNGAGLNDYDCDDIFIKLK
jgi:prepilin-type N-terminal cleavage/methylation domain-containing protein